MAKAKTLAQDNSASTPWRRVRTESEGQEERRCCGKALRGMAFLREPSIIAASATPFRCRRAMTGRQPGDVPERTVHAALTGLGKRTM
ncbi:hypothetical protein JET64_08540 [Pseudomonas putida]|nr:hypothetical protein [Pseudomonas putida]